MLFALSLAVFALHLLFSFALFGCLGATPALWRYTRMVDSDDEAMAALRDFVGKQCDTQRGKCNVATAYES